MALQFKRASKKQAKLRMALIGPAGSGKTFTALSVAKNLGGSVAVIDTERGSASKYASLFDFDVIEPDTFSPEVYVEAIHAAEDAGYEVLVIDSLSHAWMGRGGALEMVDQASKKSSSGGNSFGAWREVTPKHNALVDAIVGARLHVIATMRSKMEYVQEKDDRGKTTIRKVGLQPVQRDGLEYEFDVVGDLDQENNLIIGKTRCPELAGKVINRAGQTVAEVLKAWLSDGAAVSELNDFQTALGILGKSEEEFNEWIFKKFGVRSFAELDRSHQAGVLKFLNSRIDAGLVAEEQADDAAEEEAATVS